MEHTEILKYLKKLNSGSYKETMFLKQISKNVDFGKVWEKYPKLNEINYDSYEPSIFYFIKSERNEYIGAVLKTPSELFWLMRSHFRKKGYLTKALKSAIIPHIFRESDEQQISINRNKLNESDYNNSKRVAELLGFRKLTSNSEKEIFILKKHEFDYSEENLEITNTKINNERIEILKNRTQFAAKLLKMTQAELEMAYDNCNSFSNKLNKIEYLHYKIDDIIIDNK